MRILLTGGTGLVGGAVLRALVGSHSVTALTRRAAGKREKQRPDPSGATMVSGDLATLDRAVAGMAPFDALIHCAADFAAADMGAAEAPLIAALEAGRLPLTPGARVLYTGGVWLYPDGPQVLRDETSPLDPLPAFAWMVDHWRRIAALPHIDAVMIHPGLVFDSAGRGAIAPWIAALEDGRPVPVIGDAGICWPMVHADDLADLYRRALTGLPRGESVNAVAVSGVPVDAVIRALAAERGIARPVIETVPVSAAVAAEGPAAAGFARNQRIDARKARRDLGWTPCRPVPHLDPPISTPLGGDPNRGGAALPSLSDA